MVLISAFLLGLFFGSYANVYFYRFPRDISTVRPRSFCPGCGKTIPWHDNVPVVSWLLLGGKCRACGSDISVRYLWVELLCAFLFLSVAWRFVDGPGWMLAAFLFFAFILAPAFRQLDGRHPLRQAAPGAYVGLILGIVAAALAITALP